MTAPDLSVIIVSWNVRRQLLACIDTLAAAIGPAYSWELIVVDNASDDDSVVAVRDHAPVARVIANAANHLYTAAANQGLELASGRYLLLLNPDCLLNPGSIARLITYRSADTRTSVWPGRGYWMRQAADDLRTARFLPTPWSETLDWLGLTRRFPRSRFFAANLRPAYPRDHSGPVPLLSGACLLFSKRLPVELRRLDAGFPMYGEDVDLCRRIQMAGYDTALVADAVIIHAGGESSRQSRTTAAILAADGIQRYFRRWHGRSAAWQHRLGMASVAVVKWLAFSVLGWLGRETEPEQQRRLHATLFKWAREGGRITTKPTSAIV